MSIKSLLQSILLLLIFLIIGGIYFLYFYTGPIKYKFFDNDTIRATSNKNEIIDQEVLENMETRMKENSNAINSSNKDNLLKNKKNDDENLNKIKNLTKEIEYITSNKNGDIFKIFAKFGKTNLTNSNILDLEEVNGVISSTKGSQIEIKSNYAEYNYDNQNSQFYTNVEVKYDGKIITCDNLDLQISKNYAVAYNNVKVIDKNSTMKAQMITLNLLTKDININSQDNIKIFTN